MKKIALTLLMTALTTSVACLPAFAAETVTFNGGHIYQTQAGKPGTIKLDLTNIDSQANVKMTDAELMTYLDNDGTVDKIIYTDEVGKGYSIRSIVADLNKKDGVPVYSASGLPTITAKTPLTMINCFWQGDDTTNGTLSLKYYLRSDYLTNDNKAKVYDTQPTANYLIAPGTTEKINKPGKYLLVVHDNGAIDQSPVSLLCVNVGATNTSTATTAPTLAPTVKVTGWTKTNGLWHYFDNNGVMKTGWINDGGAWYYLNSDGAMKTGWLNDNGTWYYLNDNGSMASNTVIDGYTLDASGAWIN
jgi:hypothetical protein